MRLPNQPLRLFAGIALFMLAAGALLLFDQTLVRVVCGSILYFLLPGYFLILALLPEQEPLEQTVLSIAISAALSTLCILALLLFAPGLLTVQKIYVALTLLTTLTLCIAIIGLLPSRKLSGLPGGFSSDTLHPQRWWIALLLILFLAATLRLLYLDHSELQDDEIDIANVAVRILRGDDQVVFQDRRGPAQTVITAAAYALGGRPGEWILRLPAVITALATIAALIALASRLLNRWIGLLSGLLLSLDGFVLAYGRIVQMQSTLLLMVVVAVYCFYQLYRSTSQRQAFIYQSLGTLFFGFGILAHYEMALLAPVLLFLYFAKYRLAFWQRNKWGLLVSLGILLLTTGAFYLAFILNPAFDATLAYYRDDIVGRAIINNSAQLLLVGLFYNSIYFFAALYLGAAIALLVQVRQLLHSLSRWHFILLLLGFVMVVGFVTLWGGHQRDLTLFAIALLVAALCVFPPNLPLATRLLFLWFAVYFIPYIFLLGEVHIHYYAFSPPLAILSALGWNRLHQLIVQPSRVRTGYRVLWAGAVTAVITLSTYYLFLVFVQPLPEYALTFPNHKHPLFPTPYSARHGEAFGFPHRSGWQTIAWLYRTGALRGSFETNELWLKPQWYTQWQNAGDGEPSGPRYYLVADLPHRLQASPWPSPFAPDEYHLWGVVTVQGQPRLHIYERNTFAPRAQVSYFADEEMAAKLDSAQTIDELYRAERYQADRTFYAQAAQQLADKPAGPLLLYIPEQSAYYSLYDQSDRAYLIPAITSDPQARAELLDRLIGHERDLYALYWGVDEVPQMANLPTWLNQELFPVSEEWIGNLRLVTYDVPSAPLAAMQTARTVQLGNAIQLVGYTTERTDNLHLSLFWRALEPIAERYKVFVHLLDETNTIVSQQDGEPAGGQLPTDTWPAAQAAAAGNTDIIRDNRAIVLPPNLPNLSGYKLAIGMYNPVSGERLPLTDPDGTRLPNDMLLIPLQ